MAWLQTGPTGPPHPGEPAVSRGGGRAERPAFPGQPFPVSGLQEGWLNVGRGVSSGRQQNSLCVDSVDLLLARSPCLFFFFFLWESYFKLCSELT